MWSQEKLHLRAGRRSRSITHELLLTWLQAVWALLDLSKHLFRWEKFAQETCYCRMYRRNIKQIKICLETCVWTPDVVRVGGKIGSGSQTINVDTHSTVKHFHKITISWRECVLCCGKHFCCKSDMRIEFLCFHTKHKAFAGRQLTQNRTDTRGKPNIIVCLSHFRFVWFKYG